MKLILASASITRRKIMDSLNLNYEVVVSDIEEDSKKENPQEYVEELSLMKAKNVYEKVGKKDAIIIAADSIIYKDGRKYEKPKTLEEAKENLRDLGGKTNQGITGVTIVDASNGEMKTFSTVTNVTFKKISEEDIEWYIAHEENLTKKAGYSLEGTMSLFLDKLDGDYYNVLGLPLGDIYTRINELGYSLKDFE